MVSVLSLPLVLAIFCGSDPPSAGAIHDVRLAIAFGKDAPELKQPLRLWLPRLKIAVAAGDVMVQQNGDVRVTKCSIAVFDPKDDSRVMTRVHSDSVILVLDRPVERVRDLGDRKIVAVEVAGFSRLVVPN